MLTKKVSKLIIMASITSITLLGPLTIKAFACTTVVVGKGATTDGSTIAARNEDAKTAWDKRFVVHERTENAPSSVYTSKGNGFTYPLPKVSYKYTATPEWNQDEGQFEEDGINEKGVALSATESAEANEKALKADPLVDNGVGEDSITSVVLPYINSAKEGVEFLGKIVDEKGSAESNGVIFSDNNEVWYMEIGTGHQWVAQRVPDDSYAVIPNKLCIGKVDLSDTNNFLGSKDLIKFAKDNGLYDPNKDGDFNFAKAYGTNNEKDAQYNNPRIWDGQRILTPSEKQDITSKDFKMFMKPDKKIGVEDVATVLRSHFNGTEYDPYGDYKNKYRPINVAYTMESHILQCRPNLPSPIGCVQWLSLGVPETSIFVPFYSGINDTPKAYKQGDDKPDYNSAYWTYRRVGAATTPYYNEFMSKYTKPELRAVENKLMGELEKSDKHLDEVYKKDPKKAEIEMTDYCNRMANYALKKAEDLNKQLITETTKKTPVKHDSKL